MNNDRRKFIRQVGSLAIGGLALSSCVHYVPHNVRDGMIVIRKSDLEGKRNFMVRPAGSAAPIFVSRDDKEQYQAVLMLCTHKRCTLRLVGDVLECPCHGSEFSPAGDVLSEPAEQALSRYAASSDTNNIYIKL